MASPAAALLLAAAVVALVLIAAAYVWYNATGWADFSFTGAVPYAVGAACSANPPAGSATCPSGKTCCPAGQTCNGATCQTPCSQDSDCPPGDTCDEGVCASGSPPSWTAAGGRDASALRFRNCVFTVVDPKGVSHTQDVTAVLNGMAVAYAGAETTPPPATLRLDRPLNAFSFVVPGVNDSATVTTAADAAAWYKSATTLAGEWRTI